MAATGLGAGVPVLLLILVKSGRVNVVWNPNVSVDEFLRLSWAPTIFAASLSLGIFVPFYIIEHTLLDEPFTLAVCSAAAAYLSGLAVHRCFLAGFRYYYPTCQRDFQKRQQASVIERGDTNEGTGAE